MHRYALPIACAFFLAVKAIWVLLPVYSMGLARLGDDALVYLWVGKSSVLEPKLHSPAIRDILALRLNDDPLDARLEFDRARVTMRTAGTSSSPFDVFIGVLLKLGIGHKAAFAAMELTVALALTGAIAAFLHQLVGPLAAAIGLVILAFVILPNQGLHYLIPSILCLSVALLLWTELLRPAPRWSLAWLYALSMPLIHKIGLAYLAITIGFSGLAGFASARRPQANLPIILVLLTSLPVGFAIDAAAGGRIPPTGGLGEVSFSSIGNNLAGFLANLSTAITTQALLYTLAAVGLAGLLWRGNLSMDARILSLGLFGSLFAAVAVEIPGNPGDLSSRLLVPVTVLASGFAGALLAQLAQRGRGALVISVGLVVACVGSQVPAYVSLMISNVNNRVPIYEEAAIRADLTRLPTNASILWLDTDILMMAGLLEGAWRYSALPYSMYAPATLKRALANREPLFVALPFPGTLNSLSAMRSTSLRRRFYGFDFADFAEITVSTEGRPLDTVYLRLSKPLSPTAVTVAGYRPGGQICPPARIGQEGLSGEHWVKIDLVECSGGQRMSVRAEQAGVRVVGLQLQAPKENTSWLWGSEGVRLTAQPRAAGVPPLVVNFGWSSLFGSAEFFRRDEILSRLSLISDGSGIIWAKLEQLQGDTVPPL